MTEHIANIRKKVFESQFIKRTFTICQVFVDIHNFLPKFSFALNLH